MAAEEFKKCFIITPISGENTEIRRKAEGVIDSVIDPILEKYDLISNVSHRMHDLGSITNQVIEHILSDDLVIANLTGLNPNVMYEVAVRHAIRKPIIVLAEQGTILPFDLNDERTIFYTNDMKGVVELKESLNDIIPKALTDERIDNPIYRAAQEELIIAQSEKPEPLEYVLKRLDSIESRLSQNNWQSVKNNKYAKSKISLKFKIDASNVTEEEINQSSKELINGIKNELNIRSISEKTIRNNELRIYILSDQIEDISTLDEQMIKISTGTIFHFTGIQHVRTYMKT